MKDRVFTFPGRRMCPHCPDLEFKNLEEHSEHLATHNPSPAQWDAAYKMMEAGKENAKAKSRADNAER